MLYPQSTPKGTPTYNSQRGTMYYYIVGQEECGCVDVNACNRIWMRRCRYDCVIARTVQEVK